MADSSHVSGSESYLLTVNTWAMTVVLGLLLTKVVPVLRSNIVESQWTPNDIAVLATGSVILLVQMTIIFGVAFLHGEHGLRYRTDLLMIDLVLVTFPAFVAVDFVTSASPAVAPGGVFDQDGYRLGLAALALLFAGLIVRDLRVNPDLRSLRLKQGETGDVEWVRPIFFMPFHGLGLLFAGLGALFPNLAPVGASIGLAVVLLFVSLTVLLESTLPENRLHARIMELVTSLEEATVLRR